MRAHLTKPWLVALLATGVLAAAWVALDRGPDGPVDEELTTLRPAGAEVLTGAAGVVLAFLVLWALFWLGARLRSGRGHRPG